MKGDAESDETGIPMCFQGPQAPPMPRMVSAPAELLQRIRLFLDNVAPVYDGAMLAAELRVFLAPVELAPPREIKVGDTMAAGLNYETGAVEPVRAKG